MVGQARRRTGLFLLGSVPKLKCSSSKPMQLDIPEISTMLHRLARA